MTMTKYSLIIVLIVIIGSVFLYSENQQIKFPAGRDREKLFGDGSFQIQRNPDKSLALVRMGVQITIEERIYKYYKKKMSYMYMGLRVIQL